MFKWIVDLRGFKCENRTMYEDEEVHCTPAWNDPEPQNDPHPQNDPQIDPKMICNPKRFPKIDPEMMPSTEGIPQLDPEMITQHANGKYLQAQNKQEETEESGNIWNNLNRINEWLTKQTDINSY